MLQISISAGNPSYTLVNFSHKNWGNYHTLPYTGEQYFVGYGDGTTIDNPRPAVDFRNKITFDLASNSGQMHKVLMNDDFTRTLQVGDPLPLMEGYTLKFVDISTEGAIGLISLLQNGNEVDTTPLSAGQTYVYTRKVGNISDLPIIVAHVSGVNGMSTTIDSIFQISQGFIKVNNTNGSISYVTVTPVIPPMRTPEPTPTPAKGSISVSSSPSGASIYLDSAYQGETPKTINDISIGTHYLELTLKGYIPWSDSIDVRDGFTSYPSIPLMIAPTPTITSTPTPRQTMATVTQVPSPTPTTTSQPKTVVKEINEPLNGFEGFKDKPSWLESILRSILDLFKSIF